MAGCGRLAFEPLGGDAVDASGDGASAVWPHIPSGCQVQTDVVFEAIPPAGWTRTGTVMLATDATAPYGDKVAQWTYPTGFTGGSPPGVLTYDLLSANSRDVYIGIVWKPSNPWQNHASNFNTLLYFQQDENSVLHSFTIEMLGPPPYTLAAFYDGVEVPRDMDAIVELGVWHLIEFHAVVGTTATSGDAVVQWWIDGTLVGSAKTNLVTVPFLSLALQPIWGGVGDTKVETDHFWMNRATACTR